MASTGKEISKDLAMIKGQLGATETRLQMLMVEYGDQLLEHDAGQELKEVSMGIHLMNLLLKLEIYREHVDKFTTSVRKKYGMPELVIRRDSQKHRSSFLKCITDLQNELKDLSPEEKEVYIKEKLSKERN